MKKYSRRGIVLSHLGGNMNVRAALKGLNDTSILHTYITGFATFGSSIYSPLFKIRIFKQLKRRLYDDSIKRNTKSFPLILLTRSFLSFLGITRFSNGENNCLSRQNEAVFIDKKTANYLKRNSQSIDGVYCYEDQAYYTFIQAKNEKIKCIYDEPTGYWRYKEIVLNEEKQKNPSWSITLGGLRDSEQKLLRKDKEIEFADAVIVASSFTKETLSYYPGKLPPIKVIPYGFPKVNMSREYEKVEGRKIKALFVGSLSQQKGLSYLFEAWGFFKDTIELTIAGSGEIDKCPALHQCLSSVNYIGTLLHDEMVDYMAKQDVLVFPSLFDGFGLVVTEAMSQGTPCIASNRSCGPDIISDGYDGWLVEAGNSESLKYVFDKIVNNPSLLKIFGERARLKAAQRPWSAYENELSEFVKSVVY